MLKKKLVEGVVVQSNKFVNGIFEDNKLFVGDYLENNIYDFSKGVRANEIAREQKRYAIISSWEMNPHLYNGSDVNSYQNRFVAKELNEDGSYNENGEEIYFSTSGVFRGSINECDINIIKIMKKIFI